MDEGKAKLIQSGFLGNTGMDYFHNKLKQLHDAAPDEETKRKIREAALQRHLAMHSDLKS